MHSQQVDGRCYRCPQVPEYAIVDGRILGFTCERHRDERLDQLQLASAANSPAHTPWWFIQGWLSLMTASAGFAVWGPQPEWLPLVGVSLLPSMVALFRRWRK